ncbi:unnamed protein product [Closterium sp. NIES-54]
MVQQVLQRFGFTYSSPQSTPLPTGHSLSAPPSDESVEPSDPHRKVHWDAAKRVLRYLCSTSGTGLVLGGRARVVLIGHAGASWVDDLAMQRSSQGYTFSLGSGSVSWRSTRSSSVLSSSCEAEIYAGAMAAQELRWLTYLLTELGEAPRSPPVLLRGDSVIHPELALPFLTGLVTSCSPPLCLWGHSFGYDSNTGGTAGGAGGAACARGTRGAAGAGAARDTSPRGATGAGGARGQTV